MADLGAAACRLILAEGRKCIFDFAEGIDYEGWLVPSVGIGWLLILGIARKYIVNVVDVQVSKGGFPRLPAYLFDGGSRSTAKLSIGI